MRFDGVLVTALCALALPGCGDDATEPQPCAPEVTSVDATISTGSTVTFDWSPACAVALLLVEEGFSDRWSVSDPDMDENTIRPPVTYGVVPAGATESEAAAELEAGVTYELILWRIDPETGGEILLAVEEFTR